jgi:diguanylate cyclase (GGDEF)-like protein
VSRSARAGPRGARGTRSAAYTATPVPERSVWLVVKVGLQDAELRRVTFSTRASDEARAKSQLADVPTPVLVFYAVASLLLFAYGMTLFVRRSGQVWTVVDNQLLDALEVVLALACLGRALRREPGRLVALALGTGLLAWALGDVIFSMHPSAPSPSVDDALYLAFYPLAYLALMLLVRSGRGHVQTYGWLDGIIAGLGAAAICAAFAFDAILSSLGGSPAQVAVNLAYPVGDLILLAMAIGAVVVVPRRPARLLLFAAGCSLLAVGDTVYLFQSSLGTYRVGTPLDLTWPIALLLLSASVWLPWSPPAGEPLSQKAPRFALPVLASLAGVVILLVGNLRHVSSVAVGLATAVLVAARLRVGVSLRELSRLTESRRRQAVTDELTGLGNRRHLLHELDQALAVQTGDRRRAGLALLLIDLDHFKEINDSFGHPTGDALLQQIGPRIRRAVRPSDLVTRLGGDEFAVILTGADARYATRIAERITAAMNEAVSVEAASLHIGASIGIALSPTHGTSADELLRCADVAMYRAKATHSGFDIYEAALDDGADRLRLIEDLRMAIDERKLLLHYQPEIDLETGHVVTVEALLRWQHPNLGLVPPESFLPLAEDSGLIRPLTTWVLEQAITDCAGWWHAGHQVPVAVNVLATDLFDTALPGRVGALLGGAGLPAAALVVEITETMVMADLSRSKRVIGNLSEAGIRVSIDDFGTGFSSLAYLSDLAVAELKLDRLFTSRLRLSEPGSRDEAIVRSAIDLGHALGLQVVAEGIERLELIGLLTGIGCDRGQGFAIEAPRPPADLDFAPLGSGPYLSPAETVPVS